MKILNAIKKILYVVPALIAQKVWARDAVPLYGVIAPVDPADPMPVPPDPATVPLREVIYGMGLNLFVFMAILLGLVLFQIIGYRWYMKNVYPKKRPGWAVYVPIFAVIVWVAVIIGIVIGIVFGSRYFY